MPSFKCAVGYADGHPPYLIAGRPLINAVMEIWSEATGDEEHPVLTLCHRIKEKSSGKNCRQEQWLLNPCQAIVAAMWIQIVEPYQFGLGDEFPKFERTFDKVSAKQRILFWRGQSILEYVLTDRVPVGDLAAAVGSSMERASTARQQKLREARRRRRRVRRNQEN